MNALESQLVTIARVMTALKSRFALVGGLAVGVRCEPRFTKDIDLAVSVASDRDAEATVWALKERGYEISMVLEHETTGRLSTLRLQAPGAEQEGVVVDVLFASSGIEPELVSAAELLEVTHAVTMPVARIGDLIALKTLARDDRRRPQDAGDLRALLRAANPEDLALARAAVKLITARGYHRGRDLDALLAQAIADAAEA